MLERGKDGVEREVINGSSSGHVLLLQRVRIFFSETKDKEER